MLPQNKTKDYQQAKPPLKATEPCFFRRAIFPKQYRLFPLALVPSRKEGKTLFLKAPHTLHTRFGRIDLALMWRPPH